MPYVPPLTRDALDQMDALRDDLARFWGTLTHLTETMADHLLQFDPERLPAPALAAWVQAFHDLCDQLTRVTFRLSLRLGDLQDRRHDPVRVALELAHWDTHAAPTDYPPWGPARRRPPSPRRRSPCPLRSCSSTYPARSTSC